MEIIQKGTEEIVLMAVREAIVQKFQASDWTDLRVGFLLSIEKSTGAHDTITGLTETIGTPPRPQLPWTDRVAIGITGGTGRHNFVFLGYTNAFRDRTDPSAGTSKLVSSDIGVGTTNTNYWRFTNEVSDNISAQIIQNSVTRAATVDGSQVHFTQSAGGAGGYATLLTLRFTRQDARGRSNIITMEVPKAVSGAHSANILFTNDPSREVLEAGLETLPTTAQRLGPVELNFVPDSLFWYWPFSGSRLRVHCAGILKKA